jgi:uncharacterized protein with NAD-binding domain and iron-sulfur cluster
MASLAAAYELSKTQSLRDRFAVTVFQRGWRLGGKCASGRAPHPADPQSLRIEEHGLHVWFGFYFNAFSMMRECYAQLAEPTMTLATMFAGRSDTPLMECIDREWRIWPLTFPEHAGVEPGVTPSAATIPEMIPRILRFLQQHLCNIAVELEKAKGREFESSSWLRRLLGSPAWANQPAQSAARSWHSFAASGGPTGRVAARTLLISTDLMSLLNLLSHSCSNPEWLLVRDDIRILAKPPTPGCDMLRRFWILCDLTAAILRGMSCSAREIAAHGLSALDECDFRQWLTRHGATDESIHSAPVRGLYDLCFAYADGDSSSDSHGDFAAGTALRCLLRITMWYPGAICYTMNAGMGEAVIAPLYKVLRANGVDFRFFHKVEKLNVSNGTVTAIDFTVQASATGGARYEPLQMTPGSLAYWGAKPDFAQLVNGGALQARPDVDFESDLSPAWGGEVALRLDLTEAPGVQPIVVLGISIGGLGQVTADLNQPGSRWASMMAGIGTVATQSAQIWMNVDLAGIGYRLNVAPAMIAAPEPQDVWADMSAVLATEGWTPQIRPASVQYLCGPLKEEAFGSDAAARAQVEQNTAAWLHIMSLKAWPCTASVSGFRWDRIVAKTATSGAARLGEQHLRANFVGSERYVLSLAGTSKLRFYVNDLPADNLYLAGDWTRNGLDAGCVEAAVMSGIQAARAIRGDPPFSIPGAHD